MVRSAEQIFAAIRAVEQVEADDPDRLVSTLEAGRIAARTQETIRAWAKSGRLPFVADENGWRRYRVGDVLAALQRGRFHCPGCTCFSAVAADASPARAVAVAAPAAGER